jgi:S1-C subfamily serine protease
MGGRFAMKLLFLIFLTALAAQNSLAQQPQDPSAAVSRTPVAQPAPAANGGARPPNPHPAPPRKDIPAIARAANGAIVSIVMSDKNGHAIAKGTGFLISKDGGIVTNYHVIENGSSAVAKLPDGAFFVVDGVLASDKARDVALVKAHGENFRTLTLGNSDRLEVGEEVVAIGNPLSLESTVSNGIVSGIRIAEEEGGKFLQVTTPISPGSSGGPLFNMAGEVVGITTLYLEGGENLNFAIPINDAKRLLLAKSSKIQALPNEPEPVKAQTHGAESVASDRDYYQQLYDAGGFALRKNMLIPDSEYVCFSDDAHSGTFFAFRAMYYDETYINALNNWAHSAEKMKTSGDTSTAKVEETWKQLRNSAEIMQKINAPPYVEFVSDYVPTFQKFYPNGGGFLIATVYEKAVEVDTHWYRWDGSSWVEKMPAPTNTRIYKVLRLSIAVVSKSSYPGEKPTNLRYVESYEYQDFWGRPAVPTTRSGEAAGTDTSRPSAGACEKIPDPK